MAIQPVNQFKTSHIGRHTGAAAGLAAGSAYIIKNRQDLFIEGGKKAAEALGHTSKAVSVGIPAAVAAGIIGLTTLAGTLIGAGIDKIKNNIMQKKATEAVKIILANQVEEQLKNYEAESLKLRDMAAKAGIELD